MSHLIFDQDGELIDVLNFENTKELKKFREKYPTYVVIDESEATEDPGFADDEFVHDDGEDDILW